MKLIIDAPDEIVKKGFEGPLSDEERQILIRAIGNGTSYEEPQGEHEITNDDLQAAMTESYRLGYELAETKFKRPQGEWVVQRLQSGFDDVYCPYCNARPTRSEYGYYLRDNFCHECGADMRKGGVG